MSLGSNFESHGHDMLINKYEICTDLCQEIFIKFSGNITLIFYKVPECSSNFTSVISPARLTGLIFIQTEVIICNN